MYKNSYILFFSVMSTRNYNTLGIMTGTSLDGLDLAIIKSDGKEKITFLKGENYNFDKLVKTSIKNILGCKKNDSIIDLVEENYTKFIIKNIKLFLKKNKKLKVNLIGFHGQTITHQPKKNISWQIGNAKKIFECFKIPVVYNFRKNDISLGGNGAPLTPIFHNLIRKKNQIKKMIFINLGGISNLTISDKNRLISFDSGPCCYLSNEFIRNKINKEFDNNGINALEGFVNKKIIKKILKNNYFKKEPPKSLDRLDFNVNEFLDLNLKDGLATINEFIALSIFLGSKKYLEKNTVILLGGGGRKNIDLKNRIIAKFKNKVITTDQLGLNGDLIESYAFAYLAIRRIIKKPISFNKTTGTKRPTVGGDIIF